MCPKPPAIRFWLLVLGAFDVIGRRRVLQHCSLEKHIPMLFGSGE
jgi:hypothetical protein